MPMTEKKIDAHVTASDDAQIIALVISLMRRLSPYERERPLRTVAAYFDFNIVKRGE